VPWIFLTRAAGSGQPLLSARLKTGLQRHRCRIKDWPSSQAAALLWIFSMRALGSGHSLLSAWLEHTLQRHRCRIKDWPSSQAAKVCDSHILVDVVASCVLWGEKAAGGMRLGCSLSALSSSGGFLMYCVDYTSGMISAVDIFDASSGKWTTAALSVGRDSLAATSLPNQGLAIFAGGRGCDFHFATCCVL
jgi:hypothetical protein